MIFLIGLRMLTFFRVLPPPAMLVSGYTDVLRPEESFTSVPPTTTCCLPRLPTPSQDYLLRPTTTCCQPLVPCCACLEKDLRYLALDCFYGV